MRLRPSPRDLTDCPKNGIGRDRKVYFPDRMLVGISFLTENAPADKVLVLDDEKRAARRKFRGVLNK